MENLSSDYQERLDEIAEELQTSQYLAAYWDSEDEESALQYYKYLQSTYEPRIEEIYDEVAEYDPLQLIAFENEVLNDRFEGLFLPRILAFTVLRGVVNENFKYIKPQDQFRKVLLVLSNSMHFEYLCQRIGQSIQVGFALSSDIWVTNLVNEIPNKRVRNFFLSQKILKYRDASERKSGLSSMRRQFRDINFYTADFPETVVELRTNYPELKEFLLQRIILECDNNNLMKHVVSYADNKDLHEHWEFVYSFGLVINYFDLDKTNAKLLGNVLNECRKEAKGFVDTYFEFLKELLSSSRLTIKTECDKKVSRLIDTSIDDQFSGYYGLMSTIHEEGYNSENTLSKVQKFYFQNEGLSTINECLRLTMLAYFTMELDDLEPEEYSRFINLSKVMSQYINIFNNQSFNQSIGEVSMSYVKKLLKHFTDKRSRDYQDIKRFISTYFLELNFMKEKDIADIFKTRRRKSTRKKADA
ncbi:MAG: hypothetical protein EA409_04810 [Saprospirales bacterium]|jgi:hypothetical protein|nr:MAG: hypothetical protein EA409_04810 [Saprospirales bacterium]